MGKAGVLPDFVLGGGVVAGVFGEGELVSPCFVGGENCLAFFGAAIDECLADGEGAHKGLEDDLFVAFEVVAGR